MRISIVSLAAGAAVAVGVFWLGRITAPLATPPSASTMTAIGTDAGKPSEGTGERPSIDWSTRWREHAGMPHSSGLESERARLLTELAERDPRVALGLALAETQWRRRGIFVRAALRGWAAHAPAAAAAWALEHCSTSERPDALTAIIAGGIRHPEEAISLVSDLARAEPGSAASYGNTLVLELARAGRHALAVNFAATAVPAARDQLLATAFFDWAQQQPDEALAALNNMAVPEARATAWASLAAGWAMSDPAALVEYAQNLPMGAPRAVALRDGLTQWVATDAVAAISWMERLPAGQEFDVGAAAVAKLAPLVAQKPEVALIWARAIGDAERRSAALSEIIRQWSHRDAPAARAFLARTPELAPRDRISLLADLEADPKP